MSLSVNAGDLELGHFSSMADRAMIPLATAIFVTDHLRSFILPDDFCDDRSPLQRHGIRFNNTAVREKQYLIKGRVTPGLDVEFFNFDHVAC